MQLRNWASAIKRDAYALYLVSRDPRVPWYVKAIAVLIAAYAFSPVDLIPDFIPVIGYLDDVILLPLGIRLAVKLIPPGIMDEHREAAATTIQRPVSRGAAAVIVIVWVASIGLVAWVFYRWLKS